ncbi:GH25 family lysozyme [Pseudobutyrivibrio ruminis]|uniref:GH25 family lysozyme n=1 Tax=Pseudobutyrivibrio ruminis TaxID=46206 RepID=UPI000691DFC2|nr:GH25 family lysozyme [Pseudobutyrivibrio ruminis]
MEELWESLKFFIASHKAASIAVASAVGVTAAGAGGYGVYNLVTDDEEPVEVVEVTEQAANNDVYIPEFVNVKITSESLEKDLTIYISDENDNPITGIPFEVKLLTEENAESLQSYVDAIKDIDAQIAEYTKDYDFSTDTEETGSEEESDALPVDGEEIDFSKDDSEESSEDSSEDTTETASNEATVTIPTNSFQIMQILQDRNAAVTVTDENGDVVETQTGDISSDPLYLLYLDKETAVQAYTVAVNEAEGTVYTDDDMDGVITQTEMEPGDYVLCLVNDLDTEVSYEPTTYTTAANVKDKVEFKVQKEITKQIKKDVASEDGQKAAAAEVPVENKLTDTVEYVESKKVENGSGEVKQAEAVAPKSTASTSKAAAKSGGITKVTHDVVKTASRYLRTKGYVAAASKLDYIDALMMKATMVATVSDEGGQSADKADDTANTETGGTPTTDTGNTGNTGNGSGSGSAGGSDAGNDSGSGSAGGSDAGNGSGSGSAGGSTGGTESGSGSQTPASKPKHTITVKYVDEAGNEISGYNAITETKEEGATYEYVAPTITGYTLTSTTPAKGTVGTSDITVTFTYKKTTTTTTKEEATLDMSYSAGTFTIKASANVGNVTINGAAVTMSNGSGTFKVTKDGDYTLKGVATFSDGATDSTLAVTYTVSGYGSGDSTEKLKDAAGNQLYVDEQCTKEATAADYEKGKKFYYKEASYTYYGWQSIDGNTYYFDKNGNKVTGTQVIQGVSYDFGTDGVLANKGTGIDVSKYQTNIDWSQAKSAVSFAIVRCGYRGMYDGQLHEDPYFYKNMSGAKANGVSVGVYIYSTALNEAEAVQEASMAVAMAQKAGGCSYPIFIDMEDKVRGQGSLSTAQRMAILNAFVSTVQSSGYKAGVYCSKNWMISLMDANSIPGSCSVWIAQYNTQCTYSGRKNIWQYSSKGSVPGIKGYVDMNKSF